MNIYLDIDELLQLEDYNTISLADQFLEAVCAEYPDSTYWLVATSNKSINGDTGEKDISFRPSTKRLLENFTKLEWQHLKTDVINFDEDFLWFGTDLWPEELQVLEDHDALEQFIRVGNDDPNVFQKLTAAIKDN